MEPSNQPTQRFTSIRNMLDFGYLLSFFGILRFSEMMIDLATFICASVHNSVSSEVISACGWIQFVSMFAFVVSFVFFVLHLFKLDSTCPLTVPLIFSEFTATSVLTLFYIISGIVAACFIQVSSHPSSTTSLYFANMAAATFFTWLAVILYGADSIRLFVTWRQSQEGPYFSRSATTA